MQKHQNNAFFSKKTQISFTPKQNYKHWVSQKKLDPAATNYRIIKTRQYLRKLCSNEKGPSFFVSQCIIYTLWGTVRQKIAPFIFAITCQTSLNFNNFWQTDTEVTKFATKPQQNCPPLLMGVYIEWVQGCSGRVSDSLLVTERLRVRLTSSPLQTTLSKLLTYCVLRLTQPPTLSEY